MVTNLPAKAKAIWAKAMSSKEPRDKLELLRQFYSSFPKHKSTEKLEMQIKRQIKGLEEEIKRKKKKHGTIVNIWSIRKSEELQIAVIGKLDDAIQFFSKVTKKEMEPFAVYTKPTVGASKSDSIVFQVVLCPFDSIMSDEKQKKFGGLLYNADFLIVMLPSKEFIEYFSVLINWLTQYNIVLTLRKKEARIEQTGTGGLRIAGKSRFCTEEEIRQFLFEYKIVNAIVKISEETTLEDIEATLFGQISRPAIVLCINNEQERQMNLNFKNLPTGSLTIDKHELLDRILKILSLIKIYTRSHSKGIAEKPILIRRKATVIDVAEIIHKDLAKNFLYAKLLRNDNEIKVGRYFVLDDNDVIEIRSR